MKKALSRVAQAFERLNWAAGKLAAVLTVLLVLTTVSDVMLRYFFHAGSVAVQELEWQLFAAVFLLPIGYALAKEEHVRIDILYGRFSERVKSLVNVLGLVFFLLPFALLVLYTSIPFVMNSWVILESSPDPGGLPYRFIVKALIPIAFLLLLLQGLASLFREIVKLCGRQGLGS